jgi:NADPH:quinone reductase-like Zn-dependent oxidoreductase
VFGAVLPPRGTYAEYVAVRQDWLAPAPAGLDHVHAAALPTAALTAWQPLVRVAGVRAGHRVLVHAAAGGLGHLAVQIAEARGAHVIGTARHEEHDLLRSLGAATAFAEQAEDIDVVFDPISGDCGLRSLAALVPGGTLLDVRGTGPDRAAIREQAAARGVRYVEFGFTPSGADLAEIGGPVSRGDVRVVVERMLPLDEAAEAHRLSETGRVTGKIVMTVSTGSA